MPGIADAEPTTRLCGKMVPEVAVSCQGVQVYFPRKLLHSGVLSMMNKLVCGPIGLLGRLWSTALFRSYAIGQEY